MVKENPGAAGRIHSRNYPNNPSPITPTEAWSKGTPSDDPQSAAYDTHRLRVASALVNRTHAV